MSCGVWDVAGADDVVVAAGIGLGERGTTAGGVLTPVETVTWPGAGMGCKVPDDVTVLPDEVGVTPLGGDAAADAGGGVCTGVAGAVSVATPFVEPVPAAHCPPMMIPVAGAS
jgi:hypothetical protein